MKLYYKSVEMTFVVLSKIIEPTKILERLDEAEEFFKNQTSSAITWKDGMRIER